MQVPFHHFGKLHHNQSVKTYAIFLFYCPLSWLLDFHWFPLPIMLQGTSKALSVVSICPSEVTGKFVHNRI